MTMPNGEASAILAAMRDFLDVHRSSDIGRFLADHDWEMPARELATRTLPCTSQLDLALQLTPPQFSLLVRSLAQGAHSLAWGQTYTEEEFGARFLENYGWVELFGMRGHFVSPRIAAGFLVLGPETHYPDHHHVAEQIYIPLTGGTLWRMVDGAFAPRPAGDVILHRSNVSHAMRTGAAPLLALYLWRGGDLAQKSVVTGAV